jgi:hypothetical protein
VTGGRDGAVGSEWAMASLADRIRKFVSSPQGRRLIDQAQRELAKPSNQRKLRELAARLTRRRRY